MIFYLNAVYARVARHPDRAVSLYFNFGVQHRTENSGAARAFNAPETGPLLQRRTCPRAPRFRYSFVRRTVKRNRTSSHMNRRPGAARAGAGGTTVGSFTQANTDIRFQEHPSVVYANRTSWLIATPDNHARTKECSAAMQIYTKHDDRSEAISIHRDE